MKTLHALSALDGYGLFSGITEGICAPMSEVDSYNTLFRDRRQRRRPEITEDSMRFAMRWLAAGALVGVCVLAWGSNVGRDVVGGPGKRQTDGHQTDLHRHGWPVACRRHRAGREVGDGEGGERWRLRVGQPGRFSDWHVGPQRRSIINLSGSGQLEVAEGQGATCRPVRWSTSTISPAKVTPTRITSKEEARARSGCKFEDQKQRIGPLGSKQK